MIKNSGCPRISYLYEQECCTIHSNKTWMARKWNTMVQYTNNNKTIVRTNHHHGMHINHSMQTVFIYIMHLLVIQLPVFLSCIQSQSYSSLFSLCELVVLVYNTPSWLLPATVPQKDVDKWGEDNLILAPKNYMPIRIKLVLLRWPLIQLTVLLRTNLKQSGSTLRLLLSRTMYLHLHQLLFQVEDCGLVHRETLFLKQLISQQLIHFPVKTSFVISSVMKSNPLSMHYSDS